MTARRRETPIQSANRRRKVAGSRRTLRTSDASVAPDARRLQRAVSSSIWQTSHYGRIKTGVDQKSLIETLRLGFPKEQVQWICDTFGLSKKLIFDSLALPTRTFYRRTAPSSVESEKLYRLTAVLCLAEDVLGDLREATKWIQARNTSLGGDPPISLLDTGIGFAEVMKVLERIDYGVYS